MVTVYRTSKISKYWNQHMKVTYDRKWMCLRIIFRDVPLRRAMRTARHHSGLCKDGTCWDRIAHASQRVENPRAVDLCGYHIGSDFGGWQVGCALWLSM